MSTNQTIEMLRPYMKDFDSIVLPYWYKFQQPHPYYQYTIGLFIACTGITGVCLNLLVIIFFTTVKSLRTPSNMLVVNLAISDFGFSAVNGFPLKTISAFNKFWPWGKFGRYVLEGYQTSCTFDYISTDLTNRLFNIGLFGFGFLCPLFLSIFCYSRIVMIVRRRGKDFMEMAARTSTKSDNQKNKSTTVSSTKSDSFVLKSAAILLGVYSICWTPYAVVCFIALIGYPHVLTPLMVEIPCLFAKTAAVWDPCIYAFRYPRFRALLERRFGLSCFAGNKRKIGSTSKAEASTLCQVEE
ncbi:unnamed protein product [Trichobilharzia regenti]|nr:unnamed protein product [Trichobilharzia regenti]